MPDRDAAFIRDLIDYQYTQDHPKKRLRRFRWGEQVLKARRHGRRRRDHRLRYGLGVGGVEGDCLGGG